MSLLLYCANGVVLATHDSSQNIPASTYGSGVSVIPWASLSTLTRAGTAPAAGQPDTRPYAAPVLAGAAQLAAYAQFKQSMIAGGGISVNVAASGSPQMVEASTDTQSLILLQGAASIAEANSSATFQWVQSNGTAVTLTAAQITTIFTAVSTFLQATFTTLAGVLAAINASPATITTQAQVDTPPSPIPAWPTNS